MKSRAKAMHQALKDMGLGEWLNLQTIAVDTAEVEGVYVVTENKGYEEV